jgi:hypothetical protein
MRGKWGNRRKVLGKGNAMFKILDEKKMPFLGKYN